MTPEQMRDDLLSDFMQAVNRKNAYLVITKEGNLEGIVGNYRTLLMDKEEAELNLYDKYSIRLKKLVDKINTIE